MKEKINDKIYNELNNTHYLSNNGCYPINPNGQKSFLVSASEDAFILSVNSVKQIFGVEEIDEQTYFKLKSDISLIIDEIESIESSYKEELAEAASFLIKQYFQINDEVEFDINIVRDEVLTMNNRDEKVGNVLLNTSSFERYSEIEELHKKSEKDKLLYALSVGGAISSMYLYTVIEDNILKVNHKLGLLYKKFLAFNKFNIWVTPDEILTSEFIRLSESKVEKSNGKILIKIVAPSFLTALYEAGKCVLQVLLNINENVKFVDVDSPWNTRVGIILWNKVTNLEVDNKCIPFILDKMSEMEYEDFQMVWKEILSNTKLANSMVSEYCNRVEV